MTKRPTIADVARSAGVSVGTVSHALNGTAKVRPATLAKIEAAVERLSYRASAVASLLPGPRPSGRREGHLHLPRLIAVGYLSVDYVARIAVLPHRGDRTTASHIEKCLGGPAANFAVAAAALFDGCPLDVVLATAIGKDADSEWAMGRLARRNVHALPIRTPFNGRLSRCLVLVEQTGARTILNEPFELDEVDLAARLEPTPETRPACLHIEGYHVERMAQTMRRFRSAGWIVSVHTTGLPERSRTPSALAGLFESVDLVFINEDLVRDVFGLRVGTGALVEAFAERLSGSARRGDVVLTLGASGAVVFPSGGGRRLTADALVVECVDATGAGDAFAGTYVALRLHGRSSQDAARLACAAGSLAVTVEGAQGHVATLAALRDATEPRRAAAS